MKPLTVSIVTYNGAKYLPSLLRSLKEQSFQDFDLIIIDNNSKDDSIEICKRDYPEAKILPQIDNLGFGKAHNISIKESSTPWILLINQDVILALNCLEKMMGITDKNNIAVIGPKQLYPNEKIDTTGIKKSFWHSYTERKTDSESKEVWGISGSIMLLKREALNQIKYSDKEYFDNNFFMYKEDLDLVERLRKKGWKCWYESKAIAYHDRTTNLDRSEKPDYINYHSYKNHWFLLIKHASPWKLPVILLYELVKLFYLILFEIRTLKSIPEIIKLMPEMIKRRYV